MEKTLLEELTEEIEAHQRGEIRYEPDAPFIEIGDRVKFAKGVMRIRRLNGEFKNGLSKNGLSYQVELDALINELCSDDDSDVAKSSETKGGTGTAVSVSSSAFSSLTRRAKRAKVNVGKLVEKLIAK